MKRKTLCIMAALVTLAVLAFGCAIDPVRRDLADYVNQGILNIAELEKKSLEKYASVTGKNYTTDERVYLTLKQEVIPLYGRFLKGLRNIRPKTDEVKKLHRLYLQGAESLYEGFKEKMYGLEIKNENIILAGNQKIEKGRVQNERWRKELLALAKKHGLKQKKKKKE